MAGITGTVLAIATAGMGVASSIAQGIAQQNQMEAQANALEANAEILNRNAEQKRLETSINEDTQRRKNRIALARSRAAMAEAGISEGGTSIGVIAQSAADAEQDALNLRYQGESEAVNYLNNAKIMRANAENYREAGQNAFTTSLISGAFTGLSSLASAGLFGGIGGTTSTGSGLTVGGGGSSLFAPTVSKMSFGYKPTTLLA